MSNEITYSIDPDFGSFSVSIDGDPYMHKNGTWNIVGQNIPPVCSTVGFIGSVNFNNANYSTIGSFSQNSTVGVTLSGSSGFSTCQINPSLEYNGTMPKFRVD